MAARRPEDRDGYCSGQDHKEPIMNVQENLAPESDIIDLALRELVRTGRVLRSKDDQGRDVYTLVPSN